MLNLFKVIVAGGRDFNDFQLLERKLNFYFRDKIKQGYRIVIVSGVARGADKLGEQYGMKYNLPVNRYPANWNLGKRAGYIRNQEMADNADALVAFWNGTSPGTKHMIDIAKKKNLPTRVVMY